MVTYILQLFWTAEVVADWRFIYEYPLVPVYIGSIAKLDVAYDKSEMVTFIPDGINNADDFPEAIATGELSEDSCKKLVPTCESLHILVFAILLDDSIKYSLWQKFNEFTKRSFQLFMQSVVSFSQHISVINSNLQASLLFAIYCMLSNYGDGGDKFIRKLLI